MTPLVRSGEAVASRTARDVTRRRSALLLVAVVALLAVAATLRFSRLDEMEYKGDERWMFEHAVPVSPQAALPPLGMRSSAGLPNPALSVLVFVALARVLPVRSPVALAAGVVTLNLLGLGLVFAFAAWVVDDDQREMWWWGGALAAVSPFAVLLQRKLWAQSVLPAFSMLFLLGWWRRDRRWGALLWGVMSAALGQIHMSGFFLAGGFVCWEVYAGRVRAKRPAVRWRWFASGVAIAGVGIVLWLVALLRSALALVNAPAVTSVVAAGASSVAAPAVRFVSWATWVRLTDWGDWVDFHVASLWPSHWLNWFFDATGFGLEYSLGHEYLTFLRGPVLFGHPSGLAAIAVLASVILGGRVAIPWAAGVWRDLRARQLSARMRTCSETTFAEAAALVPFLLLLTATGFTAHRHYLIVAYPLPWVWLAGLALRRRRGRVLLGGLWVAQLVVTLSFLGYIHEHHGAPGGDYGVGYRWQTNGPDRPVSISLPDGLSPLALLRRAEES